MEAAAQAFSWGDFLDFFGKLLVVVIPAVCTYFFTRYSTRAEINNKILEKQLENVFAQIQRIYMFVYPANPEKARMEVQDVIENNISIVPPTMLEMWRRNNLNTRSEHLLDFLQLSKIYFEYSQYKLGRAGKKVDRKYKKVIEQAFGYQFKISRMWSLTALLTTLMGALLTIAGAFYYFMDSFKTPVVFAVILVQIAITSGYSFYVSVRKRK